jgi:nitroreductase
MTAQATILAKRDMRRYTTEPVAEADLERILNAGRMAGSARAAEPVRFIVVREAAQRAALAACGNATRHIAEAPLDIALVLVPEFGQVGAPFTLFRGPFDAGRAAQNMMLTAWELGYVSCPASMHDAEGAARVLGLPEGHYVINVIAFGRAAEADPFVGTRPRAPLGDYVHQERW